MAWERDVIMALVGCLVAYAVLPAQSSLRSRARYSSEVSEPVEVSNGNMAQLVREWRNFAVDRTNLLFHAERYHFGLVADLDLNSRHRKEFRWSSALKKGFLVRSPNPPALKNPAIPRGAFSFKIEWTETLELTTHTATRNRSMELSELVQFGRWLLAFCDYTGLVFRIMPDDGRTFQRWAIADGNGKEPKPCKVEWATVKDGELYVGSVGKEYELPTGEYRHRNAEWVKIISLSSRIHNLDWGPVYQSLRTVTNTTYPGYLWHEAVYWDPRTRRWIFLPRKASQTLYDEVDDETRGTNLLIIADETFANIDVRHIGTFEPNYGFASVRKVPGTHDIYAAIKVLEIGDRTHSKLCIFDLEGRFYVDNECIHVDQLKFEGLEFLYP
eukprot:m.3172 g.3172  ORF g.3172 m.3172 type:complete len:385 (-) comp2271_c0_seq1:310-1464(-)